MVGFSCYYSTSTHTQEAASPHLPSVGKLRTGGIVPFCVFFQLQDNQAASKSSDRLPLCNFLDPIPRLPT